MTRNWLTSSLLPSNYCWWLAMERAVEVSNLLPTPTILLQSHHMNSFMTRNLISALLPPCLQLPTLHNLPSPNSTPTQSSVFVSVDAPNPTAYYSITRLLNESLQMETWSQFNEKYGGSFTFTSRADLDSILHRPLPFNNEDTVFAVNPSTNTLAKATVIQSPFDPSSDPFTLKFPDDTLSQHMANSIRDNDPSSAIEDQFSHISNPLLPWIQDNAKVTFSHPSLGPNGGTSNTTNPNTQMKLSPL